MRNDTSAPASVAPASTVPGSVIRDVRHDLYAPVAPGERSCCCPSRPSVRVVLPPTSQRDHVVDLLLCGHHYRESRQAFAGMGAPVFDASGALISAPGPLVDDTTRPARLS